ncbi:MAG TPA: tetratricopeptide repeat protein [Bryobacteraceae bacterium]|nr:tetratricopeptide repeat protein [Bryobacteraceae bacterium]
MKHPLFLLPLTLLAASPVFSQKEKIAEIQRDILLMQDQIRALQRTQDEKLAAMQVLVQQTLDAANKANTSVAVLDAAMRDRMKEQERLLVAPVASVGSRVETMSNDFSGVRESIADLASRMSKLQNQISEINSAVKMMAAPPAPPPGSSPTATGPGGVPAGVSAETLYNGAMRDKTAGNADLAIEQFQNYLKWFGNTDLAPNAQYYIGEIKYLRGDLDGALMAFDTLLEKYPDNAKTSDAMLQKGRALVKAGFKAEARQEFTSLIKKFPSHENAAKAKTELAALNGPARTPARTTPKKR